MITDEIFIHLLVKYITYKANIDIDTSSSRDWSDTAFVMEINFAELKSEMNASQSINASQSLKKVYIGDIVYNFMIQVYNWNHDIMN